MRPVLWFSLVFAGASHQLEFWTKSSASDGGCQVSSCGTIGMCAYAPDVNMHWCCNQYETYCWGFAQACVGSTGNSSQTFCSVGSSTWCCNKEYETCTEREGQINVCIASGFKNPVAENPRSLALGSTSTSILGSSPTSSSTSTTIKPSSSSSSSSSSTAVDSPAVASPPGVTSGTSSLPTSLAISETTSATSSPQASNTGGSSSGISSGAAAGAGIGGVLGLLLIVGVAFVLGRKYGGKKNKGLEVPHSAPHSPPVPYMTSHQAPYQATPTTDMYDYSGYNNDQQYRAEVDGSETARHELHT